MFADAKWRNHPKWQRKLQQISKRNLYSNDAILKNHSSLGEDPKNIKPVSGLLFRPKATPRTV